MGGGQVATPAATTSGAAPTIPGVAAPQSGYLPSGGSSNVKLTVGPNEAPWVLGFNALGSLTSTIANACIAGNNKDVAIEGQRANRDIALGYYKTQEVIAKEQGMVAREQIQSQIHATDANDRMHARQVIHEESMAKIQGKTQVAISKIEQNADIAKTKLMVNNSAFLSSSVNQPFYGNPTAF